MCMYEAEQVICVLIYSEGLVSGNSYKTSWPHLESEPKPD